MEKRLRSSLQTSAESFLSSATKLSLKSAKPSLKTLIHSINPTSDLSTSLPLALHTSVSHSINSFKESLHNPQIPISPLSPPTKRLRRSSRNARTQNEPSQETPQTEEKCLMQKLQIYAYVALLCTKHPRRAFSPEDLLPSVRELHENLVLFESDSILSSEICNLCEEWWKEELDGREMLISQFIPFLLSRSLTLKKKVDLHRVYALRETFLLFDFEDESIEDMRLLLVRCVVSPLYYKNEDGKKFVAFTFGLNLQLLKEILAMIKTQIPFSAKSVLVAFGDLVFKGWRSVDGDLRMEIEEGFLQYLVDGAIHASSATLAADIRRVLGEFINQKSTDGVSKLLFRLAEHVIFLSLQVANSNVRKNALHLLLDLFPLEDPDATKEVQDTLQEKQYFLLERLITDDCPDIRVSAVEGCYRILHLFWEVIPSPIITKFLTKTFDDMSHDIASEVRISTLNGIMYLLRNPMSHEVLKVLLPRLEHMILDPVLSVRVATVDLLLLLNNIPGFQFHKVVKLDMLLTPLADDEPVIARKITQLLMPSYFPSKVDILEACSRCLALINRSPEAGARFCEFAYSEGASRKYLAQLVKVLVGTVLSSGNLERDQIDGMLAAAASICNKLANETLFMDAVRKLFSGGNLKGLLAVATSEHAKSSLFTIVSVVSPAGVDGLVEECKGMLRNCINLCENLERQAQIRSAHKLAISCNRFEDVFASLVKLLESAALECHDKFSVEVPKHIVPSATRKKKRSTKTKHVKSDSTFQDYYLIAVGIAWQIKDLLSSEVGQKAVLGSEVLEVALFALKAISEASIAHCLCYDFMHSSIITAYATLSLHITLQNISMNDTDAQSSRKQTRAVSKGSSSKQSVLDETLDHLLSWSEQILQGSRLTKPGSLPPKCKSCADMDPHNLVQKQVDSEPDGSSADNDGQALMHGKRISNFMKVLTGVLEFVTDAATAGLLSHNQQRSLSYASAYIANIISCLKRYSRGEIEFQGGQSEEMCMCLKSLFSYGANLLHESLENSSEDSRPLAEMHELANSLLYLISSVEICCGSAYAARLVTVAKQWLPDLVLGLGSYSMLKHSGDRLSRVPSWLKVLANIELNGMRDAGSDEEVDRPKKREEFPAFKKLTELIIPVFTRNPDILDAVGVFLLHVSIVGLQRKNFAFLLGVVNFILVKLIKQDNTKWGKLDMMISCVQELYAQIEREVEESMDGGEEPKELIRARALLAPAWEHACENLGVS